MICAVQHPTPLSAAGSDLCTSVQGAVLGCRPSRDPTERNSWALLSLGTRSETNWFKGSSVKFLFNSPGNTHFFSLTGNHQAPLGGPGSNLFWTKFLESKHGQSQRDAHVLFTLILLWFFCLTPVQTAASARPSPALSTSSPAQRNTAKQLAGAGWWCWLGNLIKSRSYFELG